MIRKVLTFALVGVFAAAIPAFAQQPAAPPGGGAQGGGAPGGGDGRGRGQQAAQAIKQIKPGFYVVTGAGGNTSVRVTNEGLIIVDTKNLGDQFYTALMEQIKTVSTQPVKYVFITHHHQDHSGNIGKFVEAGAQVIAHENLKKNLETYAPAQGKPANPNVTYAKDQVVKLGGVTAEAHYFGRGHTGGDTFVYFPDVKVVSTGDMFVATAPNADYPFGGSVVEWSKSLDNLLKLDFDTAIPGHGNDPLTKADVQAFKQKIDTIISRGAELVKKGTPKDQLLAQIKTDDIGWNINNAQWSAPARLDPFYDELSKMK
jgi:glyoxylase-like metal-dependent hydrolase (beta-lactamase superfamily II)